jgi:hypothetical protein
MKVVDLKLDDFSLMSPGYSFTVEGLFDLYKNIITNAIASDGESYYKSMINSKNIVLNGLIFNKDISPLRDVLKENKIKKFAVVTLEGKLIWNVEVSNFIKLSNSKRASILLKASDPHYYSGETKRILLGAVSNSSLVYPITYPISYGSITGSEGIVANQGNTVAYPVISIVGTCSNITVTNQTTGESMSVSVALNDATDTLVIDNRPDTRGIYLNGAKRMDLKQGHWIKCLPGDNTFTFQRDSLQSDKKHCTVELQSRWI